MLLANLLKTLSEEEIIKIRIGFQLPERSRLLFERIAASPTSPPDSKQLCKVFHITTENLYRLFSEIVEECVRILAPAEALSELKFYRSKYLFRPFITESRRIEKRLIHESDRNALEAFYEYMFFSMMQFPADLRDLDLTEEFGKKWHRIKVNPPVDDDLYILIRVIICHINTLPVRKKMTLAQMSEFSRSLLSPISHRAQNSTNPLAKSYYFQAEWSACDYEKTDPQKQISWLERALDVVQKNKSVFEPDWDRIIELQIAFELASKCNRAKEGLEIHQKFYNGQTPDTPRNALYLQRFIQVAFLAHDFKKARQILADFENYQIVKSTPSIFIFVLLMKAMLELADGDPSLAMQTIDLAKITNTESFFLASEVQIRGLETVAALKCRDHEFADQLVDRNIKWLRSRRLALATTSWIYFYQMIGSIVNFRMTGEAIRQSLIGHFANDFRAEYPDFFLLLESEMESSVPNVLIEKIAA